jgi:hypothetical protein
MRHGKTRGVQVKIDRKGRLFLGPPEPSKAEFPSDPRVGPVVHSAIRPGDQYNTLRLRLGKRQIEVFVNSVQVCGPVILDWYLTPARLELGGGGGERRIRAEFEYVEISELRTTAVTDFRRLFDRRDLTGWFVGRQGQAL